jgi:predicted adenylyl cyclase CyaB
MDHLNVEIKARCQDVNAVRQVLKSAGARFVGEDHQIDTYFRVERGRLKLREGNIENHLIFYQRSNQAGPKTSEVSLLETQPGTPLKAFLERALGSWMCVDKRREIYFVDNVKFHLDTVSNLGTFLEIEAIDMEGKWGKEYLEEQCRFWMAQLNVEIADLLSVSYSDLLESPSLALKNKAKAPK